MRVVERYSRKMRAFMGKGGWISLAPIRFVLSHIYRIYALLAGNDSRYVKSAPGTAGPYTISIGNIEVGGGGKTPCAVSIASTLSGMGLRPAVIVGGYGGDASRSGRAVIVGEKTVEGWTVPDSYDVWPIYEDAVDSREYEGRTASMLGDEAVLYIREGIPLVVDRDRKRGIAVALRCLDPTHLILDDAFHRTDLHKDLDIVLMDAERPFGGGRLLPYGTLREPEGAVRRADAIIFTRSYGGPVPVEAADLIEGKPVFFARHLPVSLTGRENRRIEPKDLIGSAVALLCGIARPASFEKTAVEYGLDPLISFRYDDHHIYTRMDIDMMIAECGEGVIFVTTAKDWSKVTGLFPENITLLRLDVVMRIEGMKELLKPVMKLGDAG